MWWTVGDAKTNGISKPFEKEHSIQARASNMDNWIIYASGSKDQPNFNDTLNTTTRRHHSKSRRGCTTCKRRRIKCDETRPACRQCVDYRRHCSFLDEPEHPPREPSPPSFDSLVEQVLAKLQQRALLNEIPAAALERTFVRMALDHFVHTDEEWLGGLSFQRLVQTHGIQLGLQAEYVLHAIMGVSSCHLHSKDLSNTDLFWIGQSFYSLSLELYREKLKSFQVEDLDSIYACEMLQGILTLRCTLLDTAIGDDLLSGFDVLLAAIRTMDSFPALYAPFHEQAQRQPSVFHDHFDKCNFPAHAGLTDEMLAWRPSSIAPLEENIRRFTGDAVFERVYQEPFAYLVRISKHEPQSDDLDTDLSFSSQVKGPYLEALENREPVAILLLSYWFSLLSRIKQWWIDGPARAFCERFYVYMLGALPVPMQERTMLLSPAAQVIGWGPSQ
jgi:hypothetical protein